MARGACGAALAVVALAAWNLAFTPFAGQRGATAPRSSLTQRRADASMLRPYGPVVTYGQALMDAAKEKGEQVAVTEDALKIKKMFYDEDFLGKLVKIQNKPEYTNVEKAQQTVELLKPLKSTVMPKFIVFLAKKRRLKGLKVIMFEYAQSMYFQQSITPVKVTSAQRLSEGQLEKIKEKMKGKVGTTDVKLVPEVDPTLIGGFTLEWGYTDPVNLYAPTHGVDMSLKQILSKRALRKGVVMAA
ncbi:unnamed protein product [Effrenium voratum]|uniref:ATP synthase subunit O, mitochondrial n=1 Tax=Effrenium voratum TaxID=2562239 RepID=A0AA36NGU1_9DINO|nr:unnamed protein product [Effrenium voratum]CAJ1401618.1 unnamed protein product [Effrenium voratum]CAJ1448465.1 unnamed protein product [Effrenium voratum]